MTSLFRFFFTLTLLLASLSLAAESTTNKYSSHSKFKWVLATNYGFAEARLPDGSVLIPLDDEYTAIELAFNKQTEFFIVSRKEKKGVCTLDGQLIIPLQADELGYDAANGFYTYSSDGKNYLNVTLNADGSAAGEGLPSKYNAVAAYPASVQPPHQAASASQTSPSRPQSSPSQSSRPQTSAHSASIAPTTEILSLSEPPAQSAPNNNIYPTPLAQGVYKVAYVYVDEADQLNGQEGKIYYNAPTHAIYIDIPALNMNFRWSDLGIKQKAGSDGSSNCLVYRNQQGDVVLLKDKDGNPNVMLLGFSHNGKVVVITSKRNSYRYLSPGQIVNALRQR